MAALEPEAGGEEIIQGQVDQHQPEVAELEAVGLAVAEQEVELVVAGLVVEEPAAAAAEEAAAAAEQVVAGQAQEAGRLQEEDQRLEAAELAAMDKRRQEGQDQLAAQG